ncbi:MAG: DMT family transporter [Saprospiraceae bacterium]|nr:DMT family transporter [Saprospiraceae bacterium]
MTPVQKSYIELHIAVLLFGFTAILGKLIELPAVTLVWWRVLITSVSLLLLIGAGKVFQGISLRERLQYAGVGVVVGVHWLTFYGAIKLSNASITLICMATTSFFTALLEPALLRQRIKGYELALGLLIIPGMALIVNSAGESKVLGIIVALVSALLAALFATLNKKLLGDKDARRVTFIELSSAWLFISLVLPAVLLTSGEPLAWWPSPLDWFYLLVLALLCTTLAYVLALRSLRHLSAFSANLAVSMEPVYGIALAWLLLQEHKELAPNFYWGVAIITLVVFSYPLVRRMQTKTT